MESINPFSGDLIKSYQEHTLEDINLILSQVDAAFSKWRHTTFEERKIRMKKLKNLNKLIFKTLFN